MSEPVTLTRAALVRLIDAALYPNPEDPDDPDGPGGPISRWALGRLAWVLLNPQPLPPREGLGLRLGPSPQPWLTRQGPVPDPWRSALLARTVIDRVVAQYQLAEVLAGGEGAERATEMTRRQLREFVDDYCGTGPRRWPFPWPSPLKFDAAELEPLALLAAGAQFQKVADATPNSPLHGDLLAAADRLFETGLRRMEGGQAGR